MVRSGCTTGFTALNQAAVVVAVSLGVLLLVSLVVADDSPASFEYSPETVTAVQTMSTAVHGSKVSQQQQESGTGVSTLSSASSETTEKDSAQEEEAHPVHTKFARTGSRTAKEDASSTTTSTDVKQEAQLNGDKEVKPNNYPDFEFTEQSKQSTNAAGEEKSSKDVVPDDHPSTSEFTDQLPGEKKTNTAAEEEKSSQEVNPNNYPNVEFTGSTVKAKEQSDVASTTTQKESATSGAEEKSAVEEKPNNYPNFEFTQQSKEESKQSTDEAASTEPKPSTSNAAAEESSKEVKPNNYPNFEFKQSNEESKQTTDEVSSTEEKQSSSAMPEKDSKDSSSSEIASTGSKNLPFVNGYDEEEARRFGAQFNQAPAEDQAKDNTFFHTESTSPVMSSEKTSASSSSESQSSAFWTDMPSATFRGSDSTGKYTSSFDLTNARNNAASSSPTSYRGSDASGKYTSSFDFTNAKRNQVSPSSTYKGSDVSGRYTSSFDLTNSRRNDAKPSSTYRGSDPSGRYPSSFDLTNARYQTQTQQQQQQRSSTSGQHADSFLPDTETLRNNFQPDDGQQFFARNPSLSESAYRFGDSSSSSAAKTFGDNHFRTEDPVDSTVYSHFNSPSSKINQAPTTDTKATRCSSNYWSTHTEQWPKFFTPTKSLITDAFGMRSGSAYGSTTMLQALTDGKLDAFSELANHGVAALLNAYTKPTSYQFSHTVVIDQFDRALASRTAAAVQAKVFENANNAYGIEDCKV